MNHQGEVDTSILQETERNYKIKLPSLFKGFITQFNNASLVTDMVTFKVSDSQETERDVNFLDFSDDDIQFNLEVLINIWGNKGVFPFGISALGDFFCFDDRHIIHSGEPPVVVIIHDYHDDQGMPMVFNLAINFRQFLYNQRKKNVSHLQEALLFSIKSKYSL